MLSVIAADAADAATPWWGESVIAGAFAILGVAFTLLGTFLSDLRKASREEAQRARETAQRWDKDARQVCATFCRLLATRVAKLPLDSEPDDEPAAPSRDVDDDVLQSWNELQLIAPADVIEAGHRMFNWYSLILFIWGPSRWRKFDESSCKVQLARLDYLDIVRKHYSLGSKHSAVI